MKKYFFHDGSKQHGPYSLDELKSHGLTTKTMVWFDGVTNWTEAQFIPELKEYIISTPPPFEKVNSINQTFDKAKKVIDKDYVNEIENKIPNKSGKKIFKYSLIVLSILGIAFLINFFIPTPEKKEKNNVADYLTIKEAHLNHIDPNGIFSNSEPLYWRIDGELSNSAKTTTYKDVKLEIEFFTETNTSLGKKTITVYKVFPPNNLLDKYEKSTFFNVELDGEPPNDTYRPNTKVKVLDAKVYENEKASQ